MEMGLPTAAVPGAASGDGYKDRAALIDKVVLAARVCFKHMLSTKKPTDFVSVTDLVGFLRTQSGVGFSAEVTRKILSKCCAFTFLHSGAAQTICDNCP